VARTPPLATKQATVTISTKAITAATAGGIDGERIIAAAIRAARPNVRNLAEDIGTIRWTDPKTHRHASFATPSRSATRCSLSPPGEALLAKPKNYAKKGLSALIHA
jgi:hypothetical protein